MFLSWDGSPLGSLRSLSITSQMPIIYQNETKGSKDKITNILSCCTMPWDGFRINSNNIVRMNRKMAKRVAGSIICSLDGRSRPRKECQAWSRVRWIGQERERRYSVISSSANSYSQPMTSSRINAEKGHIVRSVCGGCGHVARQCDFSGKTSGKRCW